MSARQRFSIFNTSANYTQSARSATCRAAPDASSDNYDLRRTRAARRSRCTRSTAASTRGCRSASSSPAAISANSTRYYTITTGADDNRDANVNDRPAGRRRRNSMPGPQYFNLDFNLSKAFFIGARQATRGNVNVFVNMTNAFNRVHYGTPSGVMTSPNFGRSTSARIRGKSRRACGFSSEPGAREVGPTHAGT